LQKLCFSFYAIATIAICALTLPAAAQQFLPDAPSAMLVADAPAYRTLNLDPEPALESTSGNDAFYGDQTAQQSTQAIQQTDKKRNPNVPVDKDGNPIPLNRQQPHRILGFMPNFRSVGGGEVAHPPGWKYNFTIATHQAFDYSSFIFLGITSLSAEGINSHPVLGKGVGGFYAYTWRGLLDKTDGTYIGAWFLPSLLHEDTRYYAMGSGHSIPIRALYVMSRQVVTRTYGGNQTPNIAGLGGKVLTQIVSREYYPAGATSFGVLATKFAYSAMRDIAFTSIREFYPDVAAHYIRKHREKVAQQAAKDIQGAKP
jgi:hypothetical protein